MRAIIRLSLISAFALAAPATLLHAQAPWNRPSVSPAEAEGYQRGVRAGEEDSRRGEAFDYRDELDYRRGDAGYRSSYGSRDRYKDGFRLAFERGYGEGYGRYREDYGYGRNDSRLPPGRGGNLPPWSNGRGRGGSNGPAGRYDLAYQNGFTDGYEEGLDDGHDGRRFDPVDESRYRRGDHGYEKRYGSKEAYKLRYRDAFRDGYAAGYNDGSRYRGGRNDDRRYDDRRRRDGKPWWWPF